jgi:hypothetical protein
MKFKILPKKTQTQSNVIQPMVKINSEMSDIQELKHEERTLVSGGPQMENDPLPG